MNFEKLISAVLRGDAAVWDGKADPVRITEFLELARDHGVLSLLDAEFERRNWAGSWPSEILEVCHQAARAQARYEFAHGGEIERVLDALSRASIPALLLKGTGLAYGLYESPILRPRTDSDLLVPPEMSETACRTLNALGYGRTGGPAGRWVGYQMQLQRRDERNQVHNIDLHWRISNFQSFAWLYSFSELARAAVPVRALGPNSLRLGNAHALVLALVHRAGNNLSEEPGTGDRLIWLYDIHLLVGVMTVAELETFRSEVEAKRIGALTIEGLSRCAARFPLSRLTALIDSLQRSPHARSGAELLKAGRLRREWIEIRAIPGSYSRVAHLAERAFPSRAYMRERYPEARASPLPILYARRGLSGFVRLIFGGGARHLH